MISGRQRARGAQNGRYGGVGGYPGILYTSRASSSPIEILDIIVDSESQDSVSLIYFR